MNRFRQFLLVALLLGISPFLAAEEKAAAAGADVIYPRNAPGAETSTARTGGAPGNTMLIFLSVAAVGAAGFVLWRQRQGGAGIVAQNRKLSVAESRSLGNRQYLVVADYDGRKFLLGVCPGRIQLLSKLDEEDDDLT